MPNAHILQPTTQPITSFPQPQKSVDKPQSIEKEPSPTKDTQLKKRNVMEELEANAQSILLRYRAINHKAAELRNMIVLPIKRDQRTLDSIRA